VTLRNDHQKFSDRAQLVEVEPASLHKSALIAVRRSAISHDL